MSQKLAIYKIDFIYDDEWYYFNQDNQSLYEFIEDEATVQKHWASLERDALKDYDLERLRAFANGEYSEEQYQVFCDFVKVTCKLPLEVAEDGFYYPEDIPIDDMNDEQLLAFLQLAEINHYVVKDYVVHEPRYVIYDNEQGYLLTDPAGYSDSIWFTEDGSNVMLQYREDANTIMDDAVDSNYNQLTQNDLENSIFQSLMTQYQNEVSINDTSNEDYKTINFINSSAEAFNAFSAVLENPTYFVQKIDDVLFCKINQKPLLLQY